MTATAATATAAMAAAPTATGAATTRAAYHATVREMPSEERPRERLERYGASTLQTAELLAILLRVGTPQENVIELSSRLLRAADRLHQKAPPTTVQWNQSDILCFASIRGASRHHTWHDDTTCHPNRSLLAPGQGALPDRKSVV